MMRSMFSGVSGLRVHQTKMDVIANNISNVNTVGFKSSRVTFNEVYSQTLSGAAGANPVTGRGGTNPMQIGLGVSVASIDKVMTGGASQRTDRALDLMISGDGFFVVGDASGTYFTRAGALDRDLQGNLVISNGMMVMGWDAVPDPANPGQFKIESGAVKPIQISGGKEYIDAQATTSIKFEDNLNATTKPIHDTSISFFDSLGNKYTVDVQFTYDKTADNWTYSMGDRAYVNGDKKNAVGIDVVIPAANATQYEPVAITFNNKNSANNTLPANIDWKKFVNTPVVFGTDAKLATVQPGAATDPPATAPVLLPLLMQITAPAGTISPKATFGANYTAGAKTLNNIVSLNFTGLTQFGQYSANATSTTQDGSSRGDLIGISVDPSGKITGRYSNGKTKLLAQIPVAKFPNPAGLEKVGDNLFVATQNSGDFDGVGMEVQSGGGKMMGGTLEMSNVDLSNEFTEMITTQRGFQANSRIITTSDEMLQELVNLKR